MELLFEIVRLYGWQALVVAVFVFATIECLKPLFRKVIKNENGRHSVYTALNYVLALGYSALWAWVFGNVGNTFHVYGSAIVVVNILYPIISNTGFFNWVAGLFKNLVQMRSEKGSWKQALKVIAESAGVDASILDAVASKVEEEYKDLILDGADKFFGDNQSELILNMKQKLAGFVDSVNLEAVAEKLFDTLAKFWGVNFDEVQTAGGEVDEKDA